MAAARNAEWRRRAELADLLQACRSRLIRTMPDGTTAGLRQEDAADLAGLSERRYAAFERGEIASPRPEMAESVASALRMTAAERSALHILATGQEPPVPDATAADGARPDVSPVFLELLGRQEPDPAMITDEAWTVIARNQAMTAWLRGWLDRVPPGQQNLMLFLFSDHCAALLPEVQAARRAAIAGLRYQYARNIASDRLADVVDRLLVISPAARELWQRHEIMFPVGEYRVRVRHPVHGVIEVADASLQISACLWMHVVVFPADVRPPAG